MVDVVRGEPEHRDHGLSQAERSSNSVICMLHAASSLARAGARTLTEITSF